MNVEELRVASLSAALQSARLGLAFLDTDLRVVWANAALSTMAGSRPGELAERPLAEVAPHVDRVLGPQLRRALAGEDVIDLEVGADWLPDGSPAVVASCQPVRDEGAIVGVTLVLSTVSDGPTLRGPLSRARRGLHESEARSSALLAVLVDAVITIDGDGHIDSVNRAGCEMFGYEEGGLIGQPVTVVVPDALTAPHSEPPGDMTGDPPSERGRVRQIHAVRRSGATFPAELISTDVPGADRRLSMLVIRDLSERRRVEAELRTLALHDAVTGLPNRVLFADHLDQALARRARDHSTVAVMLLDLDRFKAVNDSLGHAAGDQLLVRVGARLSSAVRPADTVARLGGDEFAILVEGVDAMAEVNQIAARIHRLFADPFQLDRRDIHSSVSVGIAHSDTSDRASELLRQADAALYLAKERGRNRHEIFDEELRHRMHARLKLEADLRHGIHNGSMLVHYQPQLNLRTGRLDAVEALVRWRHPEHGVLPAADFIGMAEETGLVIPLGLRTLEQAFAQHQAWRSQLGDAAPELAINLSAKQLTSPSLLPFLDRAEIELDRLWVEITEASLLLDPHASRRLLSQVRNRGIRVALDDFGSLNSSLTQLRRLPVDAVKIDMGFIDDLASDRGDRAIVAAVTDLATALDLRVIAEGVEAEHQLTVLREVGCHLAQGRFISPPRPAEELTATLA